MQETSRNEASGQWRLAVLVLAGSTALRLMFAWIIPLFPDETYYWDWSRHIAGGYFDHPPAIAVLVAGGVAVARLLGGGPSPFAVRLLPVLAGSAAGLFTAMITRRLGGDKAALRAAIVFCAMPLAASGLVLATPDAPLIGASAAALYCIVRAIQSQPRSRDSLVWWCVGGVMLGLAFSSKYTSILLPVSVSAAILLRRSLRVRLGEPGPWLACIVATIVFLPVLLWNASHGWVSFLFQIQHGLGTPSGSPLKRELDLIGGQLGLVSPILFVLLALAVWRTVRSRSGDVQFLLAAVAVGSWAFFVYSALRRSVEANWPAPAYVPAIALLCVLAAEDRLNRWMSRGAALGLLMVAVIYVHSAVPVLPLKARRDPVARSFGWSELGAAVAREREAAGGRTHVAADRYQDVSELAYHLADHPTVFCTCIGGRRNQYELWAGYPDVARVGDNLVIVLEDTSLTAGSPARLGAHFASVERRQIVPLMRGGDTIAVRRLWTLKSYRGGWETRAQ